MSFSTSAALPSTWPIESYSVELITSIFKCPHEDALRRRTELGKRHREPTWLDETVAALSVPALCIVASLASRGGMQHSTELEKSLRMYGLDDKDLAGGIQELFKLLLVVPLSNGHASLLALVTSAADALAARVVGLELVSAGSGSFESDPEADGGRALLATAMALTTAELRLTTAGAPHRTGLKKLSKQVGLEPELLERLVITALDCGLASVGDGSVLTPRYDRLLSASEGNYPETPTLDALRATRHPVAIEQFSAFLMTAHYRDEVTVSSASLAGHLPGFVTGRVGKVPAIASAPIVGTVAASITPSFEVFLPPESRPRDLVEVLAACEVGRIDRAIVGRITKASINAAISRGATADSLIAALAAATRTPLPQNVVAAIRDWAGNAVTATVARGTTIVVAPSEEARAVAALLAMHPRVVAPGVLVIADDIAERTITVTLRKHGIFAGQPDPTDDRQPAPARPSIRLDVLHARLAAYRRRDPSEPRPPVPIHVTASPPPQPPIELVDASASQILASRIERWEAQCDEVFDLDDFDLLIEVLTPLALHDRQFIFGANSRDELDLRLGEVLSRPDQLATLNDEMRSLLAGFGCRLRTVETHIDWHHDHLFARLEAAARTRSTMMLDLGNRTCTIAITKIMPRGSTLVVLGEDATATNHAIRIEQIVRVAEAPSVGAGSVKWRPVNGMKPPPGHVRCPCGSDRRYRECCREPS